MADNKNPTLTRRFSSSKLEAFSTSSDDELEMFTAKHLEELLKIDVKTIYGYVNRGLIPYVKIECNVRFPKQRIFEWVEQHTYLPKSAIKQARGER